MCLFTEDNHHNSACVKYVYLYKMKLSAVIQKLEQWAPPTYQESYDNSCLLVGNPDMEVKGVLVSLDCIESVIDEAIDKGCNVVIAHHPIVFGGLKSFTGRNYVERTVIKAIKNEVAIYAIHTNLDNVSTGVNKKISDLIGLKNQQILRPSAKTLYKLEVICPTESTELLREALFSKGAGAVGKYKDGWFGVNGSSGYTPQSGSNPATGKIHEHSVNQETKLEFTIPSHAKGTVMGALYKHHPYEEFDHKLIPLENINQTVGSGMIGELEKEENLLDFLKRIKNTFACGTIKYTHPHKNTVKKVALCGGSGFFLLKDAMTQGADVYITSDVKYHDFFDAENRIVLADIGHYESEQFTKDLIADFLKETTPELDGDINISESVTNPVLYL